MPPIAANGFLRSACDTNVSTVKIAGAQLKPTRGDVSSNIEAHVQFVDAAASLGADVIFFPELSLTGYEPRLAASLATDERDSRLDVFQHRSDEHGIIIGVGLPYCTGSRVMIGMVWFAPGLRRRMYAKQILHDDELPFFAPGMAQLLLELGPHTLAPAVCYESLQPSHAARAVDLGADIYLASVAKSATGVAKAMTHYPSIAANHRMYVMLVNGVGPSDDFISVGYSAVWNRSGALLAQMDDTSEGIVLMDTHADSASVHLYDTAMPRDA